MAQISLQLEAQVVQRALVASGYDVRVDGICGTATYSAFSDWVSMHVGVPTTPAHFTWSCSGRALSLMGEDWQVRQVSQIVADLARRVPRPQPPSVLAPPSVTDDPTSPVPRRRASTVNIVVGSLFAVGLLGAGAYVMLGGKKTKRGKKKRKRRGRRAKSVSRRRGGRRGRRAKSVRRRR